MSAVLASSFAESKLTTRWARAKVLSSPQSRNLVDEACVPFRYTRADDLLPGRRSMVPDRSCEEPLREVCMDDV